MQDAGIWLTPLILLPGVALLVVSTSERYGRIHDEVHHLFEHEHETSPHAVGRLKRRARLFRNALLALYICICLFSLSSLFGMIGRAGVHAADWAGASILVAGIASLFAATVFLIRESLLSLEIVSDHLGRFEDRG